MFSVACCAKGGVWVATAIVWHNANLTVLHNTNHAYAEIGAGRLQPARPLFGNVRDVSDMFLNMLFEFIQVCFTSFLDC